MGSEHTDDDEDDDELVIVALNLQVHSLLGTLELTLIGSRAGQ